MILSICTKGFFTIYRVTYIMLLLHDNMSHFVAYVLQFQEIIVYKILPLGVGGGARGGSIASLRSILSCN